MRRLSMISTLTLLTTCLGAAAAEPVFTLTPDAHGKILRAPDGRVVFRYMTKKPIETNLTANSVCCLYPLYTPKGTRAVDFAPGDHRHHRGVFLAWHATKVGEQGADFWGWGEFAPTEGRVIKNRGVKLVEADDDHAAIEVRNDWMVEDEVVIKELLAINVAETNETYVIDLDYRLTPTVDVTLAETAFGGFCVKGRKEGKALYTSPNGEVKLPKPHHLKPETDWPAAPWYDYTIRLDTGQTVGVAVLDHPDNPPSTWHNLHPIAMVNPCIVALGPVEVKKDRTLRLRYRLVVHDGSPPVELLNKLSTR